MRRPLLLVPALALAAGCGAGATTAAVPTSSSSSSSAAAPTTSSAAPTTIASTVAPRTSVRPTTATPRATRTTAAVAALPPFTSSVATVTAADLPSSWRAGCPVAPSQLRMLTLSYVDFGGAARTGRLVVNATNVQQVVGVFATLYANRFPIRKMVPVDAYGGSDDRSVADDNTAGFNCRKAVGGDGSWSIHAYGQAIDVNPVENPYLYNGTVDPPAGAAYTNRSDHRPGMAYSGGVLVNAFAAHGWKWGASFGDYQHFSTNGK